MLPRPPCAVFMCGNRTQAGWCLPAWLNTLGSPSQFLDRGTGSIKLRGPAGATQLIRCTERRDMQQLSIAAGGEYASIWASLTQKERCYCPSNLALDF